MKHNHQTFRKLVRDKVPQIIEAGGRRPKYHVLIKEDRWEALRDKLNEEIDELQAARGSAEILEEAADVYEVLLAIVYEAGHIDEDLMLRAKQKRREKGSFDKFFWLDSVEEIS